MIKEIIMPKLGQTMEEGTINKWLKKEGDKVEKGEVILEITTDKATLEVEAYYSGVLRKILVREGEVVPVTQVIGYIADSMEEVIPEVAPEKEEGGEEVPSVEKARKVEVTLPTKETPTSVKASPLAKRLARELGVDLSQIKGTGPGGRIVREDVERAAREEAVPKRGWEVIPLKGIKKIVAEKMVQSKAIAPHFYLTIAVDMSEGIKIKERGEGGYNAIFIKAAAKSLQEFPLLNASLEGENIILKKEVNIGLAVATEEGLVVPVVKGADKKSLSQIEEETKLLISRALDKKLTPEDMSGGTFTISNLGMMDIENFIAVINPPQAAILAVGKIAPRVKVVNDAIAIRPTVHLTLSCDHRVIDGMEGARFLGRIKEILEKGDLS